MLSSDALLGSFTFGARAAALVDMQRIPGTRVVHADQHPRAVQLEQRDSPALGDI